MKIRHAIREDLPELAEVERQGFPPAEAAGESVLAGRLAAYPDHFWLLEDDGRVLGFIDGMTTDEPSLTDAMYEDAALHKESGAWQMIFGVVVRPECRRRGYASALMEQVIADTRAQRRRGLVLTCKEELIGFYQRFGFIARGVSASLHGGAVWYEMHLTLTDE
ncbi:MAG: GNAT family N-acetyltransferase [Eubacteriales bacterium]|nr:GNAT family N-acetyltransferase [Eubacteriales bacterium]